MLVLFGAREDGCFREEERPYIDRFHCTKVCICMCYACEVIASDTTPIIVTYRHCFFISCCQRIGAEPPVMMILLGLVVKKQKGY